MGHIRYSIAGVTCSRRALLAKLRPGPADCPPPEDPAQVRAEEIIRRANLESELLLLLRRSPLDGNRPVTRVECVSQPLAKAAKRYCAQNKPADRESAVLVRLVAAVSAAFYEFDLHKDTSPVITEIINALALHGIALDRETVRGWLHYAGRVAGQADGLLPTRVKGTFCKLLGGMLRDHYGWLPTAEESHALTEEERAARAEKLREARAEELHADLAKAGIVVSVEDILEALTFVDASI